MPRVCTVCNHEKHEEIDKALINNETLRNIAKQFNVSSAAVNRHRQHLPATLSKAKEAQEVAKAGNVMDELKGCMERIKLLFDACDRWLRDVDNPGQYDIGPRAQEIIITYTEKGRNGKLINRKAPLSRLLSQLTANGIKETMVEMKHADPRELILKTANCLQGQIDLLAKLIMQLEVMKRVEELEKIVDERKDF